MGNESEHLTQALNKYVSIFISFFLFLLVFCCLLLLLLLINLKHSNKLKILNISDLVI